MTPKLVSTESLQPGKVMAECVCVRERDTAEKQRDRGDPK